MTAAGELLPCARGLIIARCWPSHSPCPRCRARAIAHRPYRRHAALRRAKVSRRRAERDYRHHRLFSKARAQIVSRAPSILRAADSSSYQLLAIGQQPRVFSPLCTPFSIASVGHLLCARINDADDAEMSRLAPATFLGADAPSFPDRLFSLPRALTSSLPARILRPAS